MKRWITLLLLLVMLFCTACGSRTAEPTRSQPPTTAAPQTQLPETEHTEGIRVFEEGEYPTETGDLQLRAAIAADAKVNGQYLHWLSLYQLDSTALLAVYSVSEQPMSEQTEQTTAESVQYAACYDLRSGSVTKSLAFAPEPYQGETYSYGYFTQTGQWLWYICSVDGETTYTAYNSALEPVRSFTPLGAETGGLLSPDGTMYYTSENFRIYTQPTDGSAAQPEALTLSLPMSVTRLEGVFHGENGATCLLLSGYAADLQHYSAIVNAADGEVLAMSTLTDVMAYCQNGLMIQTDYDNATFLAVGSGSRRFGKTDGGLPNYEILPGEYIMFYEAVPGEQETWLTLSLVDASTGECLGTTQLTAKTPYAVPYSYCLSEEAVVFLLAGEQEQELYRWDYASAEALLPEITVEKDAMPSQLPQITPVYDPASLLPQPCASELSDLRERADALQERYGVEIFLAQECAGVFGGYVVTPLTDRQTLSSALDALEEEMAKYPDGFFRQFTEGGISLYLAGELKGVESDNLDYAGGFQTEWNSRAAIVMDCRESYEVLTTLHHEISHAIDGHLVLNNAAADDARWNEMNPAPDCYTYDYGLFGTEENQRYTYWSAGAQDAYFIDGYSLTFEKEDRARLFEHIMSGEEIDWENAPHLREKINYFAECIRSGFDTSGWQEIRWERFLDN